MLSTRQAGYLRRLSFYVALTSAASMAGSLLTRLDQYWVATNPLWSGPFYAVFSLGGAIAVVAVAQLGRGGQLVVAGALSVAIVAMWWLFATSSSSTSALVFFYGWLVGLPVAAAVAVVTDLRARARLRPPPPGPADRPIEQPPLGP